MMEKFSGDKKEGEWLLVKWEKRFVSRNLEKVPKWIETYHLTLLTLLWGVLVVFFGFLAKNDLNWLWGVSLMIVFQYVTDMFDGAVGRYRKTGLVKWGFYMDHFLDYVFLYSILIAYVFVLQEISLTVVLIGVILGAFMVNSFLSFAATNKFEISYFGVGPSEIRFLFIIFNIFVIYLGVEFLELIIPYILILGLIFLIGVVFKTQKKLWKIDMNGKRFNK
tara:strand:+ start:2896 stop:3558 length:663 start_codon:yes stop_codon:yes gene_type:complete